MGSERITTLTTGEFILIFIVCFLLVAASVLVVFKIGVNVGVRAAARGEYVVVRLPDGTDVVVKPKENAHAK